MGRCLGRVLALCWIATPAHGSYLFAGSSTFLDISLSAPGTQMDIYATGIVCPVATSRDGANGPTGTLCTTPDGAWSSFGATALAQNTGFTISPLDDPGFGFDPGSGGGDNGGGGGPPGGVICGLDTYEYARPDGDCPVFPGVGGATYDYPASVDFDAQYYYGVAGPNFKLGAVVGTFSTSPTWSDFVLVGDHYTFTVPEGVTDFYVIVNDGYRGDNTGAYEVFTPEPGSDALLGAGLIGLALWRRGKQRRERPR